MKTNKKNVVKIKSVKSKPKKLKTAKPKSNKPMIDKLMKDNICRSKTNPCEFGYRQPHNNVFMICLAEYCRPFIVCSLHKNNYNTKSYYRVLSYNAYLADKTAKFDKFGSVIEIGG